MIGGSLVFVTSGKRIAMGTQHQHRTIPLTMKRHRRATKISSRKADDIFPLGAVSMAFKLAMESSGIMSREKKFCRLERVRRILSMMAVYMITMKSNTMKMRITKVRPTGYMEGSEKLGQQRILDGINVYGSETETEMMSVTRMGSGNKMERAMHCSRHVRSFSSTMITNRL